MSHANFLAAPQSAYNSMRRALPPHLRAGMELAEGLGVKSVALPQDFKPLLYRHVAGGFDDLVLATAPELTYPGVRPTGSAQHCYEAFLRAVEVSNQRLLKLAREVPDHPRGVRLAEVVAEREGKLREMELLWSAWTPLAALFQRFVSIANTELELHWKNPAVRNYRESLLLPLFEARDEFASAASLGAAFAFLQEASSVAENKGVQHELSLIALLSYAGSSAEETARRLLALITPLEVAVALAEASGELQ